MNDEAGWNSLADGPNLLHVLPRPSEMEERKPWNETARKIHGRPTRRYPSDSTDKDWKRVDPLLPSPSKLGRPYRTDKRESVKAMLHIAETGCHWRHLPKCLPPFSTVRHDFQGWRNGGVLEEILSALTERAHVRIGRNAEPSAGFINSQSVRATESGGPRGYDAGRAVEGRKRHIAADVGERR